MISSWPFRTNTTPKSASTVSSTPAASVCASRSRVHVLEAIAELCKGRSTVVIAHRLCTIMHADRILVIEAGDVVEAGRHDELLRKGGRYALFYKLQFQSQEGKAIGGAADALPERVDR